MCESQAGIVEEGSEQEGIIRMQFDRVVGLGLCVIDEIYRVEELSLAAARTRYRDRVVSPGGMMSNALAQSALLGCRTHLLSQVGDDALGHFATRALRDCGVVTRKVVRNPAFATSVALVLVDQRSGERRFVVPDRRRLEREAPDLDLSGITRKTLLLVDGHFPAQARRAVRRAREVGARVIADFHSPRPGCLALLPDVDHAVLPEEFAVAWGKGSARETLRVLHDRFGGTPVITRGARGAIVLHEGKLETIPARRVKVRDTTGAGDAFHGGFAAGLYRGLDVMEALELATRAAAHCCTGVGGFASLLGQA